MALDIGDKRIGIAISDETNTISTGIDVIERKTLEKDIEKIKDYTKLYEIGKIVVGMPLTMKGEKGIQAEKVNSFIDSLRRSTNIEIVAFDERLTTALGEKLLLKADISRKKRKAIIDKLAAQIILQDYLDFIKRSE